MNALAFGVVAMLLFVCNPATSITVSMGTDQGSVSTSVSGDGTFSGKILASESGIRSQASGSGDVSIEQSASGGGQQTTYGAQVSEGELSLEAVSSASGVSGSMAYDGYTLLSPEDVSWAAATGGSITASSLTEKGQVFNYNINGVLVGNDLPYHAHRTTWYINYELDAVYDPNAIPPASLSGGEILNSCIAGMVKWNTIGLQVNERPFDKVYGTTTMNYDTNSMYDGKSVISVASTIPNPALAMTVVRADANRNFIEGSIGFNANYASKMDGDKILLDIVSMHEAGHVLGLPDFGSIPGFTEGIKKEIMYYNADGIRSKYTATPAAISTYSADFYKKKMNDWNQN